MSCAPAALPPHAGAGRRLFLPHAPGMVSVGDPQLDIRTVGCAATATCEGAVSYDLSDERLTERGYPDGRTRRRGQEPAEPPQVNGISVGFSASTTGLFFTIRGMAGDHETVTAAAAVKTGGDLVPG